MIYLENREVFYRWIEAIFEILKVFNDNGLIAFAFHENERLILHKFYNILEIKEGNLSNYSFIVGALITGIGLVILVVLEIWLKYKNVKK